MNLLHRSLRFVNATVITHTVHERERARYRCDTSGYVSECDPGKKCDRRYDETAAPTWTPAITEMIGIAVAESTSCNASITNNPHTASIEMMSVGSAVTMLLVGLGVAYDPVDICSSLLDGDWNGSNSEYLFSGK